MLFIVPVKNQTDVMPKLQRNKADVGIDPNARSAQGQLGRSGPKAWEAKNWIKHKSLGSPNEKYRTCEESNDQAYKARKSEREDRGLHPGGRRSKRECCNTAKFPLGTRPGSELIGAEEAERAWPQLVRCAVPYAWCPISEDEDKRENRSGEEASSTPSGDPSSGPKPRPERGPRPWEASRSGRGAEAKTSVIRECIAKMQQSYGHMHQNKAEKSRKASGGRRVVRGCAAKLHERKEMKLSEAPKFTDQYRSNRLKAIGCERALVPKGLGQPHQRADGAACKCARTERASRKQMQGSEDRGWLHRARMSSRGAVGVPRSKRGDAGRVKGSECREWSQWARMKSRSADGAMGRQPEGAGKPHLKADRSTDAPERKDGSEVQDDKTPRRSNDADGPGHGVNDHQLRADKRLGGSEHSHRGARVQ
ncbi:hypothetical protein GGX14DRAFT_385780 [Mycena pura]|uniref:Uncharacterized protein n=1 Tax=Mycena pura TaxID=153505 RepID=A0AAD6YS02_9AGAR|nr:hypothetical protein GGX14DRAFT_385780 [Mycena pura]